MSRPAISRLRLRRLCFTAPVLALLSLLGGCNLERSLIFPGAATRGRPDALVSPSAGYELIDLTTRSGSRIVAQFGAALDDRGRRMEPALAASRPTVIFFYGNGSCLAYTQEQFERFRRIGVNVLVPEFPGYGMSEGIPSEAAFYETADAAYDHLLARNDVDPDQIVAAGWSMGAAAAIDLASRRKVSRLITISAFTTIGEVARLAAPWAPTSWIIRSRFDNAAKIPAVTVPILLFHGELDSLVPASMSTALRSRAKPGQAREIILPSTGHNDIFALGGESMWAEFRRFIFEPAPPLER